MKAYNLILSLAIAGTVSPVMAQTGTDVHSETTDAAGTKVTRDTAHSDKRGLLGTRKITSDSKVVVDPKGLNNKTERKVHAETKIDTSGNVTEETTSVDGMGTERTLSKETKRTTENDGTKVTTKKEAMVVDPKGLNNKDKVEVEEKTATSPDGKVTTTVKKLNGEAVSAETKVNP